MRRGLEAGSLGGEELLAGHVSEDWGRHFDLLLNEVYDVNDIKL